jgi:hypothetical protein
LRYWSLHSRTQNPFLWIWKSVLVLGYIGFNLKIDKIVKIDGTLRNDGKSRKHSFHQTTQLPKWACKK